jgi:hypothetical protein
MALSIAETKPQSANVARAIDDGLHECFAIYRALCGDLRACESFVPFVLSMLAAAHARSVRTSFSS